MPALFEAGVHAAPNSKSPAYHIGELNMLGGRGCSSPRACTSARARRRSSYSSHGQRSSSAHCLFFALALNHVASPWQDVRGKRCSGGGRGHVSVWFRHSCYCLGKMQLHRGLQHASKARADDPGSPCTILDDLSKRSDELTAV